MVNPHHLHHRGWSFISTVTPILTSSEIDILSQQLGTSSIPEMIFNSKLELKYHSHHHSSVSQNDSESVQHLKPSQLEITFNAFDALKEALKVNLYKSGKIKPVKVHFAWDKTSITDRVLGESKQIEERDDVMDWTFSTCYSGTLSRNNDKEVVQSQLSTKGIDYNKLSQMDEILYFKDIILYEDELHDAGTCVLNVKIRVMHDTFFCLLRYFLRVDNVVIRLIDTRFYHVFGTNEIIREFSHRENSISELNQKAPHLLRDPKLLDAPENLQNILNIVELYNDVIHLDDSQLTKETNPDYKMEDTREESG